MGAEVTVNAGVTDHLEAVDEGNGERGVATIAAVGNGMRDGVVETVVDNTQD
ncbi:MAG: hypothetical protein QXI60_03395 [Thermofilaceae archaeon]